MTSPVFPSVSAIVVTFRSGPALKECLYALCAEKEITEIIVVNNGNEEMDSLWLEDFRVPDNCHYKLISGHGNIGFASGMNLGAQNASGDRLLIINPDAVLRIGSTRSLEDARIPGRQPCLVGGKIIYPSGVEQRGARRKMLTPWRAFVTFSGLSMFGKFVPTFEAMHREHEPEPETPVPMPVISGAFCYIATKDFWSVGGFDTDYFLHVEDIDLCRRIDEAGGQVIYTPHACAMHYGSTSKVSVAFVEKHKAKGLSRYFVKNARTALGRLFGRASYYVLAPLMVSRSIILHELRKH